tara:strand:- start:13969 stop:14664 length:696 start_codon:yes stop_codon:yes gene_type:complete
MKIKNILSRVRSLYNKGTASDDSRLSDRHIYAKLVSARSMLIKREIDKKRQVSDWIVQSIPCLELITALPNECPCAPTPGCKILRSKNQIPKPVQSSMGPELEAVTTQNGDKMYSKSNWVRRKYKTGSKYTSKIADYFIKDGYLFIDESSLLQYISISGVFEDPLEAVYADGCKENCIYPHEEDFPIDEHLSDALIQMATQELIQVFKSIPGDINNDAVEGGGSMIQPPQK